MRYLSASPPSEAEAAPRGADLQETTRRFQADFLVHALRETNCNIAETARPLDLARAHIYNLIKAFGLERNAERPHS